MKSIPLLLIVLFFSCTESSHSENDSEIKISSEDSLKATLIGKWGGLGEEMPVWNIKMDSIYYFESSTAYPYKILNGNMIIDIPPSKGILKKISVINDTLFFVDEVGEKIKGYRFK